MENAECVSFASGVFGGREDRVVSPDCVAVNDSNATWNGERNDVFRFHI